MRQLLISIALRGCRTSPPTRMARTLAGVLGRSVLIFVALSALGSLLLRELPLFLLGGLFGQLHGLEKLVD